MVRHLEKKVLLGICNGPEVSGTDAIQYKNYGCALDIYGTIYKSFGVLATIPFGINVFLAPIIFFILLAH